MPSGEVPFRGDEDLLRRLILNLLHNAVQHARCGGSVVVDLGRDPGGIRIRVTDDGYGIPEDELEREPILQPIADWLDRHLPPAVRRVPRAQGPEASAA